MNRPAGMVPALTLWQPWASLIFHGGAHGRGIKVHETRSWPAFELIGQRIVIHAGSRHPKGDEVPRPLLELVQRLFAGQDEPLPFGAAIGSVVLASCKRTEDTTPASAEDRLAGIWHPGRWAWRLSDPIAFKVARPMRGHQGIWYCPAELAEVR